MFQFKFIISTFVQVLYFCNTLVLLLLQKYIIFLLPPLNSCYYMSEEDVKQY